MDKSRLSPVVSLSAAMNPEITSEKWLSQAHRLSFMILLGIYMVIVFAIALYGIKDTATVIGTTATTILGPLTGAVAHRAYTPSIATSLRMFFMLLPLILGSTVLQWRWRPVDASGKFLRLSVWIAGWIVWFSSAVVSLLKTFG